jgi:SAM-dependent methyltransferase
MSHFNKYSVYYDILYKEKDYQGETDFVAKILNKYNPQIKTMVEFGSGTGKHAELFTKKNIEVFGVDLSQEMVNQANLRKTNSKTSSLMHFQVGDVRNANANVKADALISLFHVISYQTKNNDLEMMLKNAKAHLKTGGVLFFDFWYGPAVLKVLPEYRERTMENDSYRVFRKAKPTHHVNRNVVDVKFEVEIEDKKNGQKEYLEEVHPMRYLFLPELEYFLDKTGFSVLETGEWLKDNSAASSDSWGVYLIARAI